MRVIVEADGGSRGNPGPAGYGSVVWTADRAAVLAESKQAIGQAQSLVSAGSTPEEVREIAEWLMADPFWSQRGITIGLVLKKRDDWRSAKNAPKSSNVTPFQTSNRKQDGWSAYDIAAYATELERRGQ